MEKHTYVCQYVVRNEDPLQAVDWTNIEGVVLSETDSGEKPRLETQAKLCWSTNYLHVRFECEDDHVVATYTERDDPLYAQDVVEVFIDESGEGTHYKEFEFSPRNVIFDALIENRPGETYKVDRSWDLVGLKSEVTTDGKGMRYYDLAFPLDDFDHKPIPGMTWRINLYRIDEDPEGKRHYWAWSPTEKVDFHVPERFGTLLFAKSING